MELPALPREFDEAVARKDWETAALYALIAAAEFIDQVDPDAAEQMIAELDAEEEARPAHRGSRARRR